jgi:hypothetical protein
MIHVAPVQEVGFQIRFRDLGRLLAVKTKFQWRLTWLQPGYVGAKLYQHAQRARIRFNSARTFAGKGESVNGLLIPIGCHEYSPEKMNGMLTTTIVTSPIRRTNSNRCG